MNYIAVAVDGKPNESQRTRYKYYIDVSDRWNDYGYRTCCKLYRIMDNGKDIFIGYLNCFNYCGEIRTVFYHPCSSSRGFIIDYKTAYRLLLYTPKEERKQLISELHIGLLYKSDTSTPIFIKSIMRGWDSETYVKQNNDINKIINTDIDVHELLMSEKGNIDAILGQRNASN